MVMLVNPYRFGAAGPSDPSFASVVLLSGFDGANGGTTFVDESPVARTLTTAGNAQISTANSKFGSSSVLMDGAGDMITAADSADWDFGSGQFTVELFARFVTKTNNQALVGQWDKLGAIGNNGWYFWVSGGQLQMRLVNAGSNVDCGAAFTPTLGTWYHLMYDRDAAGKGRVYRDGTMIASNASHNFTIQNSTDPLVIGRVGNAGQFTTFDFNGNMDEIRITKGVARCGSDAGFTVPVAAFPRS